MGGTVWADDTHEAGDTGEGAAVEIDRLYRETWHELQGFIRRRCGPAGSEDLVAEVFLILWETRGRLPRDVSSQRRWLFGVAKMVVLHHGERRGRDLRLQAAIRLAAHCDAPGPDAPLVRILVRDLLAALEPEERRDVCAAALGLSMQEIAQMHGCTETRVTTRLSRARRKLRAAWAAT